MKNIILFLLFVGISTQAQTWQNADTVTCPKAVENIHVRLLYSDSLSSSYVIFIKKQVKLHKHIKHTEHVVVLAGKGKMTLGEKTFLVEKGDVIFIPINTPHSVVTTSTKPLKVISIQSPQFFGKDRVMLE